MASLDSILQKYVASGDDDTVDKLLGAAFVAVTEKGVLYSGAAGRIDFGPDAKAFSPNSFTWLASISKIMTATCLMQLVEAGRVKLDDDMRPLVPELAAMEILEGFDEDGRPKLVYNPAPITLRGLLTHTVGLGYEIIDPTLMRWHNYVGRTSTNLSWDLEGFKTPLVFQPGDGWYYGTAIDWAGVVLQKLTGQSLGQYMSEQIFKPLDMGDSTFWPEKLPQVADRTVVYTTRSPDTRSLSPCDPPVPKEHEMESGGSGVFSTADDYGQFLSGLLGERLVKKETLDEMFKPQLNEKQATMLQTIAAGMHGLFAPEFPIDMPLNHGITGVINLEDTPGKRRKGSLMWSGMANSHWWADRESGVAGVLIVNVIPHGDTVVNKLYNELEEAVYGQLLQKTG